MDPRPRDENLPATGVPQAGPTRVLRARWSIRTLRETAGVRAAMAAVALVAGAAWAWILVDAYGWPNGTRQRLRAIRHGAAAIVLLVFGAHEAWKALSLWREARARAGRP